MWNASDFFFSPESGKRCDSLSAGGSAEIWLVSSCASGPPGVLLTQLQPGWEAAGIDHGPLGAPCWSLPWLYWDLHSRQVEDLTPSAPSLDSASLSSHPPDKAGQPPCPASGLLQRLIPSLGSGLATPPLPRPRLFMLQLIKCGCLLSEDKVGYLSHLGATECQRHAQFEEILAGNEAEHMSAGPGQAGCSHLCDLRCSQHWLWRAASKRGTQGFVFTRGVLAESLGDLLSGINILVPEIISLERIKDAVKIYTDPPCIALLLCAPWMGLRKGDRLLYRLPSFLISSLDFHILFSFFHSGTAKAHG